MIYRKLSESYTEGSHLGFGNIDWRKLIASFIICQLAGLLGAVFTSPAIPAWYATLEKPSFVPPDWTFSVVWTFLYLLMGLSLYLVWRKGRDRHDVRLGMGVFGLQLALNFLWSVLFFGLRSPLLGIIGIVFLWLAIAGTIWLFYHISRLAGLLLIPTLYGYLLRPC